MADTPILDVDLTAKVLPATQHWVEIDELREQHRFFWNSYANGYWVLTQYEDIREAFNMPEVFSNRSIVPTDPEPAYRFLPSYSEPPQHMKYRHLMNRWFAPAAVREFAPRIDSLARETVEELAGLGRAEFTGTFGDQYPVKVFLLSMGLEQEMGEMFVSCVRRMSGAISGLPEDVQKMMDAWNDISSFWTETLANRRLEPRDADVDFVTYMSGCKMDGRPLPDVDIIDILVTLTVGSLDTLKSQLGWCFYHLATHPDDRRRINDEPSIIPNAVEELLRAYPIVGMARKLTRDIDFHGCPMRKDDMVLLEIPAATRDPRQFPDPTTVDFDRFPNRHIAFGASEHRCLGSHLARKELQAAIREWHRAIPDYRLAGDTPMAHGGTISLMSLPLEWSPGEGA